MTPTCSDTAIRRRIGMAIDASKAPNFINKQEDFVRITSKALSSVICYRSRYLSYT